MLWPLASDSDYSVLSVWLRLAGPRPRHGQAAARARGLGFEFAGAGGQNRDSQRPRQPGGRPRRGAHGGPAAGKLELETCDRATTDSVTFELNAWTGMDRMVTCH